MARFFVAEDTNRVAFDEYLMQCSCQRFQNEVKKWELVVNDTCVPVCRHILECLNNRGDTLPPEKLISVIVYGTISVYTKRLSLDVIVSNADERGIVGITLDTGTDFDQFIGYTSATSSRKDVRDMILPFLLERYLSVKCVTCNVQSMDRSDLLQPGTAAAMVYQAGYMVRHKGRCGICCDFDDLIPNPSPDPTPPKVI